MRSFTIRDNYEFNFTLTNITFVTSEHSKYDEATFFSIYVRFCENPYDYYDKTDGLCYVDCPDGTYTIEADQLCDTCEYTCATCLTASTCDTCASNRV